MNNDQEKNEELKKDKEGSVEFRSNQRDEIIKGAKQEDQLDKLHQGEKAKKDDSDSKPVEKAGDDDHTEPA